MLLFTVFSLLFSLLLFSLLLFSLLLTSDWNREFTCDWTTSSRAPGLSFLFSFSFSFSFLSSFSFWFWFSFSFSFWDSFWTLSLFLMSGSELLIWFVWVAELANEVTGLLFSTLCLSSFKSMSYFCANCCIGKFFIFLIDCWNSWSKAARSSAILVTAFNLSFCNLCFSSCLLVILWSVSSCFCLIILIFLCLKYSRCFAFESLSSCFNEFWILFINLCFSLSSFTFW